ncbi:MAG: AMP-binding protein [Verrucomicrobia bacterium]|nr:AMP-binding protein [Verrucomicrobiota bacterium]
MTIKELLTRSVSRRGDGIALRYKKDGRWQTLTYHEFLMRAWRVAELLARRGIKPGDRVAILRENAPDWPEMYFGITALGATAVPVDAKLQEQEVAHILRDSGARLLFSDARNYSVLKEVEPHVPELQAAILVGGRELGPQPSRRIKYLDYEEGVASVAEPAAATGRAYDRHQPSEGDIASFIYTSGTTGRQKGAMLTHANFTANVEAILQAIQIRQDDNFLLVLPLHHAFAFTANLLTPVGAGCEISFVESLKTVGENTREVSPTVLIGVPLLIEKMYNRIWTGLRENKLAWTLYRLGLRKPVRHGIAKKLGGHLRLIVTGGAPCDPKVLINFGRLGFPILEGYGLTETAPVLTFNPLGHPKPGTVGKPLSNVEIRIMDPNAEGVGEIAARGPNIMNGYYNNPEATKAVFRDGWFLTGDLGFLDADGYVTITGRKKNLIVNREGKNIYPEEVEYAVSKSPFVRESLVTGFRDADMKVGEQVGVIVVPNQEAIDAYAEREKKTLSESEVVDLIRNDVKRVCAKIAEYKRPRHIQIRWEEFGKTSTGKVKRYLYALKTEDLSWTTANGLTAKNNDKK